LNTSELLAQPLGDSAITISLGTHRSPDLLRRIHSAAREIRAANIPFVEDVVPSYLALTVFYEPLGTSYGEMEARLVKELSHKSASTHSVSSGREHIIPVIYDGVDLEDVARALDLTVSEIAALHAARTYTVDLLGFVPGFAYLSELDERLRLPRRPQPRPRVPRGSVAIAAAQTGIYPLDTPGGWHIIGSTTTVLFDPTRDEPALLAAGDSVRFEQLG
jgi:KipI family sensor histidine kinase inhibitor